MTARSSMWKRRSPAFRHGGHEVVEKKELKKEDRTFEKPEVASYDREELDVEKAFTGNMTNGV